MTDARPRRVLHVMNTAGGGAAISTLALIAGLDKRGIESFAICHDSGSAADKRTVAAALPGRVEFMRLVWWNKKIRSPAWKRPLQEARQLMQTAGGLASAAKVVAFARAHRVDLIHTNTTLNPEGARAAAWLGLPHVWHVREMIGHGNPFQYRGGESRLGHRMSRGASIIVANSEQSAACVRAHVHGAELLVVPNGIDVDLFNASRRVPRGDRKVVFGMVANVTSRWKKHEVFIRAAIGMDQSTSEARIYGQTSGADDSYERDLRELASGRVEFRGQVDVSSIMSEIDVLVHSADQESFGRVVVEAMAAGLPVVAVRGGGVAEIVVDGDTGFLATPNDASALREAMVRIGADPALRTRMGEAGRRRAAERYSMTACVDGVLDAYERAMRRPQLRRSALGTVGWP